MDKDAMRHFEVPADMRVMAEKSVEQARVAFNKTKSLVRRGFSSPARSMRFCRVKRAARA